MPLVYLRVDLGSSSFTISNDGAVGTVNLTLGLNAISTTMWAMIAAIIAIVRWNLVDQAAIAIDVRALAAALVVLVIAVIVVAVVFYSRPPVVGVPSASAR